MEAAEKPVCRICRESEGELIAPCRCRGTTRFVHRNCLRDWRMVNRKAKVKRFYCEICLTDYNVIPIYPSFWHFINNHWTVFEKMMYSSSLVSSVFSVSASFHAFIKDKRKKQIQKLGKEVGIQKKRNINWKQLINYLFQWFLYGWPLRLKLMMSMCLTIVTLGNYLLFQQWRERHKEEFVLPFASEKTISNVHLTQITSESGQPKDSTES